MRMCYSMPAKQVNGALCVYLNVILATSIPEDDSSSNCNGNGAHGMPGLAPKGGSMSRLPSCELLGLRSRLPLVQSSHGMPPQAPKRGAVWGLP
jgi:hypothetical protein